MVEKFGGAVLFTSLVAMSWSSFVFLSDSESLNHSILFLFLWLHLHLVITQHIHVVCSIGGNCPSTHEVIIILHILCTSR